MLAGSSVGFSESWEPVDAVRRDNLVPLAHSAVVSPAAQECRALPPFFLGGEKLS